MKGSNMFSRTDRKSMIIQALMVSPELLEVVLEGLDDLSRLDEPSRELVQECVDKVREIKMNRPQPPPIPRDDYHTEAITPTLLTRLFKRK